jgi:hypothetical protein
MPYFSVFYKAKSATDIEKYPTIHSHTSHPLYYEKSCEDRKSVV